MRSIHPQTILASKMWLPFGLPWGLAASTATATPCAAGLTGLAGTISFVLNETADRVAVILDGGTGANDRDALAKGVHSFSRGRATVSAGHSQFSLNHAA